MVPHDRRAFLLHEGAVGTLRVDTDDGLGDFSPRGVEPRQQKPPRPVLDAVVKAVLGGEREVWHRAEGLLHLVAAQPGDDHHVVARVGAEGAEDTEGRLRHLVRVLVALVVQVVHRRRDRASPVDEDGAVRALPVREQHLLRVERLEVGAHPHHAEGGEAEAHRHPVLLLLALHRLEVDEEARAPVLRRVRRDVVEVLARARLALDGRHLERLVERRLQLRLREGVDAQRAVEHAAEARELREDHHARRQVGEVAGDDELERPHVDRLARRRVHHHVRQLPHGHPRLRHDLLALLVVHRPRVGGVDPLDDRLDLRGDLVGVEHQLHLVAAGEADLHEDVPFAELRVVAQRRLPREELELHALEAVEVVDAGDHSGR
mmetsp:Transcript_44853/g.102985  ORF Transcript_44853/g.102985 Transcript_44853/m.102985 type:complete len:376 (-) Transcript_44853:1300-2427(-)